MLDLGLTPRTIVNGLFIVGIALGIAYIAEFMKCKSSGNKQKRIFGIVGAVWFITVGIYVVFALSFVAGTAVVLLGIFTYYWDKHIVNRLL